MTKKPLVSVVIPVYNGEKNLKETIDSILSQTYKNIEVIIVDDCSTDNSIKVIESYGDKVKLVRHQKNMGAPAFTKNTGIKHAGGELIAFSDHDDIWLPTKLEKQVETLEKNPKVIANFTNGYIFESESGNILGQRWPRIVEYHSMEKVCHRLLESNFILTTTAALIRKEALIELNGFDENLKLADDYDLWLRLARQWPLSFLQEPLFKWRFHLASLSHREDKMLTDLIYCYKKILSTWNLKENEKSFVNEQIATYTARLANYYLEKSDYNQAKKLYRDSLGVNPNQKLPKAALFLLKISPKIASLSIRFKRSVSKKISISNSKWILDQTIN